MVWDIYILFEEKMKKCRNKQYLFLNKTEIMQHVLKMQ